MSRSTHYGPFSQDPKPLREWAIAKGKFLTENHVLIYIGMSGIELATALSLFAERPPHLLYIRKETEESHGQPMESTKFEYKDKQLIFVDDFIEDGHTLQYAIQMLIQHHVPYELVTNMKLLLAVGLIPDRGTEVFAYGNKFDLEAALL